MGRDSLLSGAHWQIMRGSDVRVWVNKYIPSLLQGLPILMGKATVSRNTRVESLICPNTKTWNIDFLEGVISREQMRVIHDLDIGDVSKSDWLVWPYDKLCNFTVKSGYHWAHARVSHLAGVPSSHITSLSPQVWKTLWKVNAPPKLRHFMWKSFHGALPTMVNLFRRKSAQSPICPICNACEETIEHLILQEHVILQCPWV